MLIYYNFVYGPVLIHLFFSHKFMYGFFFVQLYCTSRGMYFRILKNVMMNVEPKTKHGLGAHDSRIEREVEEKANIQRGS